MLALLNFRLIIYLQNLSPKRIINFKFMIDIEIAEAIRTPSPAGASRQYLVKKSDMKTKILGEALYTCICCIANFS